MGITSSIFDATLDTVAKVKAYLGGDEHANEEPVHNDELDFDAADWNTAVAGVAELAVDLHYGVGYALPFSQANATASQTSVPLAIGSAGDAALTQHVAPRAGSVTGLTVLVENARSAGTLTVTCTLNGAEQTLSLTIADDHDQKDYAVQIPGVETFDAGDLLGVNVTTDGSWAAGATPSVLAMLYVAFGR